MIEQVTGDTGQEISGDQEAPSILSIPSEVVLSCLRNHPQLIGIDIPKLNGEIYLNWRSLITDVIFLRGLDKVMFEGVGDARQNIQARAFLKSHLNDGHFSAVRTLEMAKEIWEHLSRMCIGANSCDTALLVRKFYNYCINMNQAIQWQLTWKNLRQCVSS